MKNRTIRIGTRGSKLALWQAEAAGAAITRVFPDIRVEIEIIHTQGDKILDVSLSKIGDKGLFTKEIEMALLRGEVDLAVHSLKDLPTFFPEGLKLGAVLERAEVADALVSTDGRKLGELVAGDVIATSSLRRTSQLLAINPGFRIADIRGNVQTRLDKMDNGYCNAMIMAAAGLQRLGLEHRITEILDPETYFPAISQGAIGIEIRESDPAIEAIMAGVNHPETQKVTLAERAFLKSMDGGCQIPIGCCSKVTGDTFRFTGFLSSLDGTRTIRESLSGPLGEATPVALEVSKRMMERGGRAILDEIRNA